LRGQGVIRLRPAVARLPVVEHGGPTGDDGARRRPVLDFSVCTNPYGPAPSVRYGIADAEVDRYPDPTSTAARTAVANVIGEPIQHIIIGAGAAELIHAVCLAFIRSGDRVLVPPHAFAEYERAAVIAGAHVSQPRIARASMEATAGTIAVTIERIRPRLTFLCSPESPVGRSWTIDSVRVVADACERAGSLLVFDQAYDAFAGSPLGTPALRAHSAVFHLRSLTKEHALPGTRVAFGVGPSAICEAINRVRAPWSVSVQAQAAVAACLGPDAVSHSARTVALVRQHARDLVGYLHGRGWTTHASDTHYFLVDVGGATAFRDGLLSRHAIRVRDATSFGFPRAIRLAPQRPEQNEALMRILDQIRPPNPFDD